MIRLVIGTKIKSEQKARSNENAGQSCKKVPILN